MYASATPFAVMRERWNSNQIATLSLPHHCLVSARRSLWRVICEIALLIFGSGMPFTDRWRMESIKHASLLRHQLASTWNSLRLFSLIIRDLSLPEDFSSAAVTPAPPQQPRPTESRGQHIPPSDVIEVPAEGSDDDHDRVQDYPNPPVVAQPRQRSTILPKRLDGDVVYAEGITVNALQRKLRMVKETNPDHWLDNGLEDRSALRKLLETAIAEGITVWLELFIEAGVPVDYSIKRQENGKTTSNRLIEIAVQANCDADAFSEGGSSLAYNSYRWLEQHGASTETVLGIIADQVIEPTGILIAHLYNNAPLERLLNQDFNNQSVLHHFKSYQGVVETRLTNDPASNDLPALRDRYFKVKQQIESADRAEADIMNQRPIQQEQTLAPQGPAQTDSPQNPFDVPK